MMLKHMFNQCEMSYPKHFIRRIAALGNPRKYSPKLLAAGNINDLLYLSEFGIREFEQYTNQKLSINIEKLPVAEFEFCARFVYKSLNYMAKLYPIYRLASPILRSCIIFHVKFDLIIEQICEAGDEDEICSADDLTEYCFIVLIKYQCNEVSRRFLNRNNITDNIITEALVNCNFKVFEYIINEVAVTTSFVVSSLKYVSKQKFEELYGYVTKYVKENSSVCLCSYEDIHILKYDTDHYNDFYVETAIKNNNFEIVRDIVENHNVCIKPAIKLAKAYNHLTIYCYLRQKRLRDKGKL